MKLSHIASALTFAVLLSQCTVSAPKEAPLVLGPHQVLVKRGENIYSIASANNVSVRELIAVNMLEPPYAVADGQVLLLPKKKATARSRKNDFADPQGPVLINEQLPTKAQSKSLWESLKKSQLKRKKQRAPFRFPCQQTELSQQNLKSLHLEVRKNATVSKYLRHPGQALLRQKMELCFLQEVSSARILSL